MKIIFFKISEIKFLLSAIFLPLARLILKSTEYFRNFIPNDGPLNLSISTRYTVLSGRRGRRTNIERVLEYAHDCIPSIRLTSVLLRCRKKKSRKEGYTSRHSRHRTYQLTPVKSFDVVWRCLGRDPNCVIIAIGHPESERVTDDDRAERQAEMAD